MARFKATRPRLSPGSSLPHVSAGFDKSDLSTTQRALQKIDETLQDRTPKIVEHFVFTVDLVIGRNKFNHLLGRAPVFVGVCPSIADASFAYALDVTDNPVPELQLWLDIVGVAQPKCKVWMV